MNICSKKTLKKRIEAVDTPWEAEWNTEELAILNDSKDLNLNEICLLIPTKTRKEIYWKLYSEDMAEKTYDWLLKKKIVLFHPSKLCACSVAGVRHKVEALEILKILMRDNRVSINKQTGQYVVLGNVNLTNEATEILSKEVTNKKGFRYLLSRFFGYLFNGGI